MSKWARVKKIITTANAYLLECSECHSVISEPVNDDVIKYHNALCSNWTIARGQK